MSKKNTSKQRNISKKNQSKKREQAITQKGQASNPYPYMIHSCTHAPFYPTHTHGLTEIGWPEFIMDPLAFGIGGNAYRINHAYEYFKRLENREALNSILKGSLVRLSGEDLNVEEDPSVVYTYCFREVPPTFQAVREAYVFKDPAIVSNMRFIQIWVEGDYFALMDDYYTGGVTE